jgi:hypothetical protein
MRCRHRTWTDEQFLAAVASSTNFTDVLRALGLRPAGGNHLTMKRHAKRLNADTSHFNNDRRVRGIRAHQRRIELPPDVVFRADSSVCSKVLRHHVLRHDVVAPYACALCGNSGQHNGKPLTLQLDHANGVYNDNRVENLRWLCPNCHSQTETYAGRRSRHGYRIMRDQQPPRVSEPGRPWRTPALRAAASYVYARRSGRSPTVAG